MKNINSKMRPEYDFTTGIRGKYASKYADSTNVVLLDPDVVNVFKDPASVNAALRKLIPPASGQESSQERRGASREDHHRE